MKKSAFFSDILFTLFLVWLFTLCLFRYLGLTLVTATVLSALCGILAAGAAGAILQSRRKNLYLKKSDEAQKQKLLTHLSLLSDEQKTRYFSRILSAETEGGAKRFGRSRLQTEDGFYFLAFRFAPVCADEIANISRLKTSKRKILLCDKIDEDAAALCDKLGVEVKTGEKVYAFVKARNALPSAYLGEETGKKKRRLRLCFAKTNSRRFFVGGALILLASLLTPFPYYYLVFGSLMLLAALFIRIFGYS